MKKFDFIVIFIVVIILAPFFVFPNVYNFYIHTNNLHPFVMAFVKFSILATFGEMLGMRIKTKKYYTSNFGVLPKAIIWGLLGMWIAFAMGIFSKGIPVFLSKFDFFSSLPNIMSSSFSPMKLLGAFIISISMNCSFAPIFMTIHKISDTHINSYNGNLSSLIKPAKISEILSNLDWKHLWNFVFKKTIPLFWIPAHTLTFLLAQEFQILFAAICSIILGLLLSISSRKLKINF